MATRIPAAISRSTAMVVRPTLKTYVGNLWMRVTVAPGTRPRAKSRL